MDALGAMSVMSRSPSKVCVMESITTPTIWFALSVEVSVMVEVVVVLSVIGKSFELETGEPVVKLSPLATPVAVNPVLLPRQMVTSELAVTVGFWLMIFVAGRELFEAFISLPIVKEALKVYVPGTEIS